MRCRLFGHRLYADPRPGEFCTCRCGRTFEWISHSWRPVPRVITWDVA